MEKRKNKIGLYFFCLGLTVILSVFLTVSVNAGAIPPAVSPPEAPVGPTAPTVPGGFTVEQFLVDGHLPGLNVLWEGSDDPQEVASVLQILFLMSLIALAPSLLILLTGFTRIIIALSFMRQAMATQQMPPNQVLVGLALFLTLFIMTPTFRELNNNALQPYAAGYMSFEEAFEEGMRPIRRFMLNQLERGRNERFLVLFMDMSGTEYILHDEYDENYVFGDNIPNYVLIPAFILTELTWGFVIGFMIYLPFIVVDMVTASILMSMGMMMLPPAMISLPFKIALFLLMGGWERYIGAMMRTFAGGG